MSKIGVTILLSLISCLLSIANISYRIYQDNEKKNSFELAKTKDWEILLLKRDNPESLQQIRGFLENMNIVKGEQVIFGFLAKKDPDKHWDESLLDPKEDRYKVKLPEIKD